MIYLSITLRMKHYTIFIRLQVRTSFILSIPLRMKRKTNEYTYAIIPRTSFQFLWGWNNSSHSSVDAPVWLSIPLRMKLAINVSDKTWNEINFQFLWGWNSICVAISIALINTFNSFEDETYLEHRDTVKYEKGFQFLWGWNIRIFHSIGIVILRLSFNSFEDETHITLSETLLSMLSFQFLWGWNWSTFILSFIL